MSRSDRAGVAALAGLACVVGGCSGPARELAADPSLGWLGSWLVAFALTQSVEMGIYVHAPGGNERPLRERLAIAFGASAITHPIVWFVIASGVPRVLQIFAVTGSFTTDWWIGVAVAETFAFVAEALWLVAFGHRPLAAFATSLMANGLSFTLGLFLYNYLGW